MKENIAKVKKHLKENKKVYIACGGTAIVTVVGMALVLNRGGNNISISNPAFLNWKPLANTIQVSMTRPGPKSFVIQCLETQQTWPSLRETAKSLGHNPGTVSRHLKGDLPDIDGLHLAKLAEI